MSKCPKTIIRNLFKIFQHDTSSHKGSIFRKIMLLCNKVSVDDVKVNDIDQLSYFDSPENEAWRISLVSELINIRRNTARFHNQ